REARPAPGSRGALRRRAALRAGPAVGLRAGGQRRGGQGGGDPGRAEPGEGRGGAGRGGRPFPAPGTAARGCGSGTVEGAARLGAELGAPLPAAAAQFPFLLLFPFPSGRAGRRAGRRPCLVLAAPCSPCLAVVGAGGGEGGSAGRGGGGEAARRQRGAACVADGAGLGAAAAQGGGRRAGPRGGLGGGVAGALRGAVPPQEAAAAPGRLQAAGDHHRVAGGRQDQPHGAFHRRHLLRGLQVHRGDTAGQERFNSITSAYYRSAKGIILVYDITKKETFDDLPKWMKMIDKYASEDAELLLVGNKLDCEVDREITRQQGEKFAQQITGMRFCEASAKDNFNVDEIFLKLVDDILKKMPLDVIRNELSNSILSLQPEPEIPPELPPPRPHMFCSFRAEILN
uniref:small monomeric GTPase n=1 Tax=Falco tinnunculus TaxID=100819 RepID=A0A8C4UBK2_FALTI